MKPYTHQKDISLEGYQILKKFGLVYLGMEERTGKTLTSILLVEITSRNNGLVITKKKALMGTKDTHYSTAKEGWYGTLNAYTGNKAYLNKDGIPTWLLPDGKTRISVVNYHGVHKGVKKNGKIAYVQRLTSAEYDIITLDEAHSYMSAYPKPGTLWKSVKVLTTAKPLIYLSATPYAQGPNLLFNQLRLSSYSPFKRFANFYRFFEVYGIPDKTRTPYGLQETYKKCKDSVIEECKHLFITYTRRELDFEHEPEDVIHYVELSDMAKVWYNSCIEKEIFYLAGYNIDIPLDSPMKLRTTLHMIEGGVAKHDDDYYQLPNKEKIDAILEDFGDTRDLVIMYHYKAEEQKLKKWFKHALLLQATSFAEGVDLSGYRDLVIYSQDFSTARHSQRRARQANKKRDTPIRVHFYLVKKAISEQVYTTVSINKTNFIDSLFEREVL